ncbi:portal protein, partial [Escherichia coli]
MSWKRHMTVGRSKLSTIPNQSSNSNKSTGTKTNFASYLPVVYNGLANRTERYSQYEQMDQDPEIRTALNIIADFCTQSTEDFGLPYKIKYKDDIGDTEVTTIEDRLDAWTEQNDFKTRMYEIVRGLLKYGDQFFIRDPETFDWYWVSPKNVEQVFVNEA